MESYLRIAVADDEPLMRDYFREVLPRLGHQVVGVAENGRELIELARRFPVDLLITDIRMPEMDGVTAAREILKPRRVPVLFLTGCTDYVPQQDDCPTPSVMVLQKPIRRDHLAAAIRRVVGHHQLLETVYRQAGTVDQAHDDHRTVDDAVATLVHWERCNETDAWQYLQTLAARSRKRVVDVATHLLETHAIPMHECRPGDLK